MAILIALTSPYRLKRPAPFKLNAMNLNGAAFFINAVFLLTAAFLFAQPKPLKFTKQQIASETYETVGAVSYTHLTLPTIYSV